MRSRYPENVIFLTVGPLVKAEGHMVFVEALRIVHQQAQNFVALFVGSGEEEAALKAKAKEYGLEDVAVFIGDVSAENLPSFYHAADIFVRSPLADASHGNGFSLSYLQAGACGKPSISTDAEGVGDGVKNGMTGYIVADGDSEGLADRMLLLLRDEDIRARLGTAAKNFAKLHSWPIVVRQYVKLYERMIQRP
jgi:phosphatidylinositol alpha-1,6-mannosyltransferase